MLHRAIREPPEATFVPIPQPIVAISSACHPDQVRANELLKIAHRAAAITGDRPILHCPRWFHDRAGAERSDCSLHAAERHSAHEGGQSLTLEQMAQLFVVLAEDDPPAETEPLQNLMQIELAPDSSHSGQMF